MKFQNKTILLVEDEIVIALQERLWLEREGYEIKHVTTGEDAIKILNENSVQIDLILMDINLGSGMAGTEVAIRIQDLHDIPLLFLSSHTEKDIVSLTEEITSYGYVVKGSGETVLLASVKMAFRLHHSQKEVKLKEENYQRISEKLDVTLNSIGDGVIATDLQGQVVLINPVAANLCGIKEDDALGKPLNEVFRIINAMTREKLENPVQIVLETGRKIGLANHTVLLSADGHEYQISDSAAPIKDNKGNVLGVVLVFSDVTEKYRQEELLRESEERLRFALEGANDGIWDVNMKTGEVFLSPRGCEILGYESYELPEITRVWSELVYEEDLTLTNKRLEQYLNKETEIFEVEQRLKTKSGEYKWILARGKGVAFDQDGNPLRMTGTHTDISKRKMAEEALFESEEHFRALFDKAPLGYQSLDENGNLIDINQKWLEILGYEKDEVKGRWFGDFLVPEMVDAFRARFPMFKARGKVHTEFNMKKKDGSSAIVVFDGRIGHTPEGDFKQTHCILQDVTESRRAERNTIDTNMRYRMIFENSMDAIMLTSPDGRIESVNPAACRLLGRTEDEIIFQGREGVVDMTDPKLPVLLGERDKNGRVFGEMKWIKKDGTIFPVEITSCEYWDADNNKRTFIIGRDITERKTAEAEMNKYTQELIASNNIKDRILSIIAHDLKGPFSAYVCLCRELVSKVEDLTRQEISEIASVMHISAESSMELLLNLLDWSRLQSDKMVLLPCNLNLFEETEDVISLFTSVIKHKSVTVLNNIDKKIAVFSDKNALSTILRNLIDNAIKFSHTGGAIVVEAEVKNGFTEISVADSGIGISSENIDKIAGSDLIHSTTGTNGEKGSGLGIVLCKDILRLIGGELKIKSRENEGSKISFSVSQGIIE